MRICNIPGCPAPTATDRCGQHRAQRERQRGTRQQRGYNSAHDTERARWAPLVATGTVTCWRCRMLIPASSAWDLGHDDHDRSMHRGPEHPACNRATSGRQ